MRENKTAVLIMMTNNSAAGDDRISMDYCDENGSYGDDDADVEGIRRQYGY